MIMRQKFNSLDAAAVNFKYPLYYLKMADGIERKGFTTNLILQAEC
jgi:hypothetical protein